MNNFKSVRTLTSRAYVWYNWYQSDPYSRFSVLWNTLARLSKDCHTYSGFRIRQKPNQLRQYTHLHVELCYWIRLSIAHFFRLQLDKFIHLMSIWNCDVKGLLLESDHEKAKLNLAGKTSAIVSKADKYALFKTLTDGL